MSPPSPSRWDSAAPWSAWWLRLEPGADETEATVCGSQGHTLGVLLQQTLRLELPPEVTINGVVENPASLALDGTLGAKTLQYTYALAQGQSAPQEALNAILGDLRDNASYGSARGRPLRRDTVHTILWLVTSAPYDQIVIPPDAVVPSYNERFPADPANYGTVDCWAGDETPPIPRPLAAIGQPIPTVPFIEPPPVVPPVSPNPGPVPSPLPVPSPNGGIVVATPGWTGVQKAAAAGLAGLLAGILAVAAKGMR